MSPLQIAHAYNYPPITNSSLAQGVNIAILTAASAGLASNTDPHTFWAAYGLPDHTIKITPVDGSSSSSSAIGETLLDIEMSGAMGPGATLNVYVAANTNFSTFIDMYNQFVTDNDNAVMTTSFGAPESNFDVTEDQIFMQGAAQGIVMFAAAGDNGSGDGTGSSNHADYPSVSEYITAANGSQLTISNLVGDYGSEVVWNDVNCFGNGPGSTGGAISTIFQKPNWQYGPGVPANVHFRMNSGIALTASCSRPMIVYEGGWVLIGGTSAVAPQLAGMFAIATAERGSRLGQSNKLVYQDARNHYSTDFHDVTSGNNGAYQATAGWDHPTGWGSVNVENLLSHIGFLGPHGTLAGTVMAAASGSAIAGAVVLATGPGTSPNTFQATTLSDGSYALVLRAGSYSVTVSHFGFHSQTTTETITGGATTSANFTLQPAQMATLNGTVTDGSGHGYPLYADVKVKTAKYGQVADDWTDPTTGQYSVQLPVGVAYTLDVAAAFDGYNMGTGTVTLSGNATKNFALTVNSACTAPGYQFVTGGLSEDFNQGTFPPSGWTVTNAVNGNVVWMLDSQLPSDAENWTGGTGDAASADSNALNSPFGPSGTTLPYDTSLITPPIPVTSLHGATTLKYLANYWPYFFGDNFDLDIRANGGAWENILHWTASHGRLQSAPGVTVRQNLSGFLPASGSFQLRWRYYTTQNAWAWYAQIDDVSIAGCPALPGGLIMGRVTDAQTGNGLVGAKVTDDLGQSTKTIANPADPNLPAGTYMFFAKNGNRTVTVTRGNYSPATVQVTVPSNQTVTKNVALKGAVFAANPHSFAMSIRVPGSATASFSISNTGNATGVFKIAAIKGHRLQRRRCASAILYRYAILMVTIATRA